jgi:hypothetical protein
MCAVLGIEPRASEMPWVLYHLAIPPASIKSIKEFQEEMSFF